MSQARPETRSLKLVHMGCLLCGVTSLWCGATCSHANHDDQSIAIISQQAWGILTELRARKFVMHTFPALIRHLLSMMLNLGEACLMRITLPTTVNNEKPRTFDNVTLNSQILQMSYIRYPDSKIEPENWTTATSCASE